MLNLGYGASLFPGGREGLPVGRGKTGLLIAVSEQNAVCTLALPLTAAARFLVLSTNRVDLFLTNKLSGFSPCLLFFSLGNRPAGGILVLSNPAGFERRDLDKWEALPVPGLV